MLHDYTYLAQFEPYGNAVKHRVSKNILRAVWIVIFIALPFVTPLAGFARKVFKRDLLWIHRKNT